MNKTICDKCGKEAPESFVMEIRKRYDTDIHAVDFKQRNTCVPISESNEFFHPFDLCLTCVREILFGIQTVREHRGLVTVVRV